MKPTLLLLLATFFIPGLAMADQSPDGIWEDVSDQQLRGALPAAVPSTQPDVYQTMRIDRAAVAAKLANAPMEGGAGAKAAQQPVEMTLPMPGGVFARFAVVDSPIMAPALAAKFPEIKTYAGRCIDDPSLSVRFDVSPRGFHAQILSPKGAVYIDPFTLGDTESCIVYGKKDLKRGADGFQCFVQANQGPDLLPEDDHSYLPRSGSQLRTYRTAVATTGEYTAFHGGTVAAGLAAVVTAINRVSGVYEVELSIRLQLVANNNLLIYTNAGTDPYTNNDAVALLAENQSNIDSVIGNTNYDVGHVFGTGGGGLAGLGVVGLTGQKARGETGSGNPINDPFYIDYVAHELGHQFAGNHTFNGDSGSCSGGNRNGSTAYEPGSGTTIQAYAGICGNDDLQPNSDPHFHSVSFDEMINFVDSVIPAVGTRTATGNAIPTVNAGSDFTIPARTPFALTAVGTDADAGDVLTYSWEERDLGPQQDVSAGDNGSSPLFRFWTPTVDPVRTFPRLTDLIANTTVIGETLPTTTRTMNFRATVRDNRSGGAGVNTADMVVSVIDTGTPFRVTSPNTAVTWTPSTNETITWDVAGTTGGGINTPNVNILLSTDGGLTYPYTLAASTPNDGTQSVPVPSLPSATTQARVRVQGDGNVFFDISDADFTIPATPSPVITSAGTAEGILGDAFTYQITASNSPTSYGATGLPAGLSVNPATGLISGTPTAIGVSNVTISATNVSGTGTAPLVITVTPLFLASPLDSDPGWTTQGEWAFGTPTGAGGIENGNPDPGSGATGTNVFGVNLSGDYSLTAGGPYYLTAGPFDFSGRTGTALRFQRWLNTDYQGFVFATIEVSNDGTNWTPVWDNGSVSDTTDAAWTQVQYDISAVADNQPNVYVRWGYQVAGGAFAYSGWNIDDVEFSGVSSGPFIVTNTNDTGIGSLRQAVAEAAPVAGSLITFAPGLSGGTITLASDILVAIPLGATIDASALTGGLTIDGGPGTNRIFTMGTGNTLNLTGLTLTGGNGTGSLSSGNGGAIYSEGSLTLDRCTIAGNSSTSEGGGIYTSGTLGMTHCTLADNNTGSYGGGLSNYGGATVTHCTFSTNSAIEGGGIDNGSGSGHFLTLDNTIVAGNTTSSGYGDDIANLGSTVTRVGANIVVDYDGVAATGAGTISIADPFLAPLNDYGGPLRTMALKLGSPARNASVGSSITSDQRGFPIIGTADIGAYEAGTFANYNAFIWESLPSTATDPEHDMAFDFDFDGKTNDEEWRALTNPGDSTDYLRITQIGPEGLDNLEVTFPSVVGRVYNVEYSFDLDTWIYVGGNFAGTGGPITFLLGPFTEPDEAFVRIGTTP